MTQLLFDSQLAHVDQLSLAAELKHRICKDQGRDQPPKELRAWMLYGLMDDLNLKAIDVQYMQGNLISEAVLITPRPPTYLH